MTSETSIENVELDVEDGTKMRAFVAKPRGGAGRHPGVIVFQEAFGVNKHIRDVAERFAREGFVALAPELYHRFAPAFESGYEGPQRDAGIANLKKLTNEGLQADIKAAHAALTARPDTRGESVSSVGFCLGGRTSFLAAATAPLRAAVSFYGGGMAVERAKDIGAPLLMFWGGLDAHIPASQIDAVGEALRKHDKSFVDVRFSKADHGFFCDARASYNPDAARQAWALTLEFLRTHGA